MSETTRKYVKRKDGKFIGWVEGNVFHKNVDSTKHRLRKPLAWAIDECSLKDAIAFGAKYIQYHDYRGKELKGTWTISIQKFNAHRFWLDRKHGIQIACEMSKWTFNAPGDPPVYDQLEMEL